jgi:hypothetical protein
MDYKKLSLGLGVFSLALGAIELLGSKRIAETLDADESDGVIKAFGAREILAGVNLLIAPAVATNMWNRVAGDVMDLAATGLAAKNSPKNKAVWGSLAFVAGALLLDAFVANGLDRTTGKTSSARA